MKKVKVKPSKFNSLLGFIVGLAFLGIGVYYVLPNFGAFGIFWMVGVSAVTIYYAINLFSEKGISLYEMTIEDTDTKNTKKKKKK